MNAYQNVKHTMIPLADISLEQQQWIAHNADLANGFSDHMAQFGPRDDQVFSFVVQTAAGAIWYQHKEKAHWRAFDPDAYMALMERGATGGLSYDWIVGSLLLFVQWLTDTKYLKLSEALPMLQRLEILAAPMIEAIGGKPRYSAVAAWNLN